MCNIKQIEDKYTNSENITDENKSYNVKIALSRKIEKIGCASSFLEGSLIKIEPFSIGDDKCLACVLFHELLHLKHFLEEWVETQELNLENDLSLMSYSIAKHTLYSSPLLKTLPEAEKEGYTVRWPNFEERRTVCGLDKDGISEMVFEISLCLPPRYMYEDSTEYFERRDIYDNVVYAAISDWELKNNDKDCDFHVVPNNSASYSIFLSNGNLYEVNGSYTV